MALNIKDDDPDDSLEVMNNHNYRVYFDFNGYLSLDADDEDCYRFIDTSCCVDFCNRDKALEALENLKKNFYLSKYFQVDDMSDLLDAKLFFIPDPFGKKPNPRNDDSLGNCYDDDKLELDKDGLLVASTGDRNPIFFSQLALFVLSLDAILRFTKGKDLTSYFEESGDYFYRLNFDSDNSKLHIVQRTEEYIDDLNCIYADKTCLIIDIKPELGIEFLIKDFIHKVNDLAGFNDLKSYLTETFIKRAPETVNDVIKDVQKNKGRAH